MAKPQPDSMIAFSLIVAIGKANRIHPNTCKAFMDQSLRSTHLYNTLRFVVWESDEKMCMKSIEVPGLLNQA